MLPLSGQADCEVRGRDWPSCTYLICTGPRTGSTLLADALTATEIAGRPAEYFDVHAHNEASWKSRLGIDNEACYLDKVTERATGPNGVCGFKLHWHQTQSFRAKLAHRHVISQEGVQDKSLAELIRESFGNVHYFWLRRRNKVAQGISYYLASRTGRWRAYKEEPTATILPEAAPEFDAAEIRRLVGACVDFDRQWERYFRASGFRPVVLVYEDFISSYEMTVRGVLRCLGLSDHAVPIVEPALVRQSDERSLEWEKRYRSLVERQSECPLSSATNAIGRATQAETLPKSSKSVTAKLSYLICTSPRSGSTLLTDALTSTGIAGKPDEYFSFPRSHRQDDWMQRRFGTDDRTVLVDKIIEKGSTPNGIFGGKVHWGHCVTLRRMLLDASGHLARDSEAVTLESLIREKFRSPRYVWLRRRNFVAQAISHYRATHTGVWRAIAGRGDQDNVADVDLSFDFDKIDQAVATVRDHDWEWGNYFTQNRLTPLMIFYEDFVDNYEITIKGILKFLHLPYETFTIDPPVLERQADVRSVKWEVRYREIKGDDAIDLPSLGSAVGGGRPSDSDVQVPSASPSSGGLPQNSMPSTARQATAEERLPFIAYRTGPDAGLSLVTAPVERAWMNETPKRFAYRCLPMLIANQAGWFILNPARIAMTWDGRPGLEALQIETESDAHHRYVLSHFGAGVVTFTIPYLFRTPPRFNLHVRGPTNMPKDGISPLEGIVESDWTQATFTMNWKLTRPHHTVVFDPGEPIAMLVPVRRGDLERFGPEIRVLSENHALDSGYKEWCSSRSLFNAELKINGSPAQKQGWQRHYMRGEMVDNAPAYDHQTALQIRDFFQPADNRPTSTARPLPRRSHDS